MPCCIPFAADVELSRFSPAMPDIFIGAESGLDDMFGIFMCVESFAAGDLLLTLVLGPVFVPALDDFAFELAAVFFF
jgi:hypothetical protein